MPDSSALPLFPLLATALTAGVISAGGLLAYSVFAPRCQFWAPVVRSLPQRDAVALTFDDGPDETFTPAILDHLGAHGAKATFFVIGRHAQRHPGLLRRMDAEGHGIGNHSFDHAHFGVNRNRAYWDGQILDTQKTIADIVGRPPLVFRPPMGFKTWHIAAAARAAQLPVIGWSARAFDTRPMPPAELARRLLGRVSGHDILLLHDGIDPHRSRAAAGGGGSGGGGGQQHTVDAVPAILAGIRAKNLRIVPLLEALVPARVGSPMAASAEVSAGGTGEGRVPVGGGGEKGETSA
jgi:peptidoglycan/xylan/chitin deacetylase (PgdA/CDA1 family)